MPADRHSVRDFPPAGAAPRINTHAGKAAALALTACLALALSGCALTPPGPAPAPAAPAAWSAPLPSAATGDRAQALTQWWSQFDDPMLPQLIEAAQRNHGSLAQAAARIAQARATARAAGSRAWPSVDAGARATRSATDVPIAQPAATMTGVGLDMLWEIDLFGVTRNSAAAAQARAEGAEYAWHDLRVSLAADTAATLLGYRACEALVDVYTQDAASQGRAAELVGIKAQAGLDSPANAALAAASAADARNRLVAQRAECDVQIKSLVALTALPEQTLRAQLTPRRALLPQPASFAVDTVPARLLMQRPDLAALEREVLAASGDVGAAQADRYPRLSLAGTVSLASVQSGASGTNWSIGPALSLPLFDAGRRAAQVDVARARYDEAMARYMQRARDAVREVEEALVRLDAATRREADALAAADGFRRYFAAAQARFDVGAESLLDLESARRNALLAAATLVGVQRERVAAWITLYRAVGGGWLPDAAAPATQALAKD